MRVQKNQFFFGLELTRAGTSCPDIDLLPMIAKTLDTSVDSLLGYEVVINADYENRYKKDDYYWGLVPNQLCYEIKATGQTVKSIGYRMRRGKRCSVSGKKMGILCRHLMLQIRA